MISTGSGFRILIESAAGGDREAQNELLGTYRGIVLSIVRARLGMPLRRFCESQDIVQEALLQATNSLGQLRERQEAALIQWLSRIVERTLRNQATYHRAQKRAGGSTTSLEEIGELPSDAVEGDPAADPSGKWLIEETLAKLPEELREVFIMRHYFGFTFARIASELGAQTPNAARLAYRRARGRLVALLRDDERG